MKNTHTIQKHFLTLLATATSAHVAVAQIPYDPPTAQRAAPNVMLLMDSTRTTLIDSNPCGSGNCHVQDNNGNDPLLFQNGRTRLQLGRRVLTGGWGWNTTYADTSQPAPNTADAAGRVDGVMDQYRVRWGVAFYDGLGTRLALNPTSDNRLAQQRVIDFGQPGYGENLGPSPLAGYTGSPTAGGVSDRLNSYLPWYRTTRCCGNNTGGLGDASPETIPWFDEAVDDHEDYGGGRRQARALQFIYDYINSRAADAAPTNWTPPGAANSGFNPPSETLVRGFMRDDPTGANVLQQSGADGCRRNFVIMLMDGHGGRLGSDGSDCSSSWTGPNCPADWARRIALMPDNSGSVPSAARRNQVFSVHFGASYGHTADRISDCGYDGTCGNGPLAFQGAPGGTIANLAPMYAAFSAIFQLVLSGQYLASPPTITRQGDAIVISKFRIQDCQGLSPDQCNIGRVGSLAYSTLNAAGAETPVVDFAEVLLGQRWDNRNVFTSYNATATNCGAVASPSCTVQTASIEPVDGRAPGNLTVAGLGTGRSNADFLRGHPNAIFANGVERSENVVFTTPPGPITNPYKLMDVANSQAVIVGAPTGIGEDVSRWEAFRSLQIPRSMRTVTEGSGDWIQKGSGLATPVGGLLMSRRDQIVYIGGNDGLLHAFLAGIDQGSPAPGRTSNYGYTPLCASTPLSSASPSQSNIQNCVGQELWAYSPRLLQPTWGDIRSGHYYMVDGTPVVSDVLFTKNDSSPSATMCTGAGLHSNACANDSNVWEYRTVLMQCLGGGGPGCFALDVSNPYRPELLWERGLPIPNRNSSTSRPQIIRVQRRRSGVIIPYYVGIMGGGLGETTGTTRKGSVLAVGLEDGNWFTSSSVASADFAGAPTCLDTNGDSYTDTCYLVTTDAVVYKARIGELDSGLTPGDSTRITLERFFDGRAHLGALPGASTIRAYGRIVATFDSNRDLRLFFGTGNFEDMQNATERNYFFQLIDRTPELPAGPWSLAVNAPRAVAGCGGAGYLTMPAGEKIVFDPVISNGVALFTSYRPNTNPCVQGVGYLNGVTVDACAPGIDTNNDGTADSGVPGGSRQSYAGLPVAPVVNEQTGGITVARDAGAVDHNQGVTRRLPAPPVTKLWWRVVK